MPGLPSEMRRRPQLGLFDTISLAVGIVVGVAIFKVPAGVFRNVADPWHGLAAWLAGGALSFIGALCFAELAAAYPRSGGQYVFLSRAFGPWMGFLFGWAQLVAIITGTIGAMAYVFADYAVRFFSISPNYSAVLAVAAIVGLTAMNLLGVVVGKTMQNILTVAKVIGLGGIVAAGLFGGGIAPAPTVSVPPNGPGIGLAMILILYAYGGWSDVAYVAAETRQRRRNIPLALLIGVGVVTLLYLAINVAYLAGLGFAGLQTSAAPAADVLSASFGPIGGKAMSLLVMISALGAINGMIFAGARVYAALGADHRLFALLNRWSPRFETPVWSLGTQGIVATALVTAVGTATARTGLDSALGMVGLDSLPWHQYGGGFETLVAGTAPVFWLFFLLTGLALFVLRWREPTRRRPFRVPLNPVVPVIFCGMCLYMLYAAVVYAGALALLGIVPLGLGVPLYLISRAVRR